MRRLLLFPFFWPVSVFPPGVVIRFVGTEGNVGVNTGQGSRVCVHDCGDVPNVGSVRFFLFIEVAFRRYGD